MPQAKKTKKVEAPSVAKLPLDILIGQCSAEFQKVLATLPPSEVQKLYDSLRVIPGGSQKLALETAISKDWFNLRRFFPKHTRCPPVML